MIRWWAMAHQKIDYTSELNPEQLAVVEDGEGACLVLAGAGSGKTRTITYRVAYLLEQGVDPGSILLLTFTNKAAQEMLGRVSALVGSVQAKSVWGGTFHHIAARILRHQATQVGYQPNFTILDAEDSRDQITATVHSLSIETRGKCFPASGVLQEIISLSRNMMETIPEVIDWKHPSFVSFTETIEAIGGEYDRRKRFANAMDFDDLLTNLLRLLEIEGVGERLAAQFNYVLVDEYQDTNKIQGEIVRRFASIHKNLLVVGDDAQSIYAFRGATIDNILNFPKLFGKKKNDVRIFKLETNYRSTPEILTIANYVIKGNPKQFEKNLKSIRDSFVKPALVIFNSPEEEAEWIAQRILELRDEGVSLPHVAVLFRAAYHSQLVELALAQYDIPYDYRGGLRFFERGHIKDVLAFLRVVANPKEEVAWLRILNMQTGIGQVAASKIYQRVAQVSSIEDALTVDPGPLNERAVYGWQQFLRLMSGVADMVEQGPAVLIRAIADSDYRDYLESVHTNWRERLDDIAQLALFAERQPDLATLLQEVSLASLAAERHKFDETEKEQIVLSTIHQAKGLEWEAVFIINLVDGAFPHKRALTEDGGLEEERRLFYVAVTRAKTHLHLSYPLVGGIDRQYLNQPSSFLREIPSACLEKTVPTIPAEPTITVGTPIHTQPGHFLPELSEL